MVHQDLLGATGATGATGPPRITQLNVTNTYQIGESFLNNFTTSDNLIQVFCDNGDSVIAGGYRILVITAPLDRGNKFSGSNRQTDLRSSWFWLGI